MLYLFNIWALNSFSPKTVVLLLSRTELLQPTLIFIGWFMATIFSRSNFVKAIFTTAFFVTARPRGPRMSDI